MSQFEGIFVRKCDYHVIFKGYLARNKSGVYEGLTYHVMDF